VLLGAAGQAWPQDAAGDLETALHQHRLTLSLVDGALVGRGADFLLDEGRRAHFFLIGEEHGVAEVPELASAIFSALRTHGYEHLFIETSPGVAALLDSVARYGEEAIAELVASHPLAVPFYGWHEDARLLVDAVQSGGDGQVIHGVDYEFMFSAPMWLAMLVEVAPTPEAAEIATRYLTEATAAESALLSGGGPRDLFLAAAEAADFELLRSAFPANGPALAAIQWMESSAQVWRLWFDGEHYASNRLRTDLMRSAFVDTYRRLTGERETGPRSVLRFGGNHLYRGRTPVNVFDLGTLTAMLAEYEGAHAFNVMIVGDRRSDRTAFSPAGSHVQPPTIAGWLAPLYAAAHPSDWTVFDLRPLRAGLHTGRLQVEQEMERLIWGYDAFLILSNSRPAGFGPIGR